MEVDVKASISYDIISQDIKCTKFLKAHLGAVTGKKIREFHLETTVN